MEGKMWDIIKSKVERWDGESWFGLLLWLLFAGILFVFLSLATTDKMVRCYYLESSYTSAGILYEIKSDIDYAPDMTAFSSPKYKETMEVFKTLPQCPLED
jgi:hypothetical protein